MSKKALHDLTPICFIRVPHSHGFLLHLPQTIFPLIPWHLPQRGMTFIHRLKTILCPRLSLRIAFMVTCSSDFPSPCPFPVRLLAPLCFHISVKTFNLFKKFGLYTCLYLQSEGRRAELCIPHYLQCLEQGLALSTCPESVISLAIYWMNMLYIMLLDSERQRNLTYNYKTILIS